MKVTLRECRELHLAKELETGQVRLAVHILEARWDRINKLTTMESELEF